MKRICLPVLLMSMTLSVTPAAGGTASSRDEGVKPRARVILDNDFGGDPDGLFQLAHHLLSPSLELRGLIGSQHYDKGFYGHPGDPGHACAKAGALLAAMGLEGKVAIHEGAAGRIGPDRAPLRSAAARFIVAEAMRDDVETPLYIACGAGLTDLAGAYLMEPRIGPRIRLVWIGGPEHEGLALPPPGGLRVEYNLGIDLQAGQVVFNESDIPIWQVPRDAYRQTLVSDSELRHRMDERGRLGGFLLEQLLDLKKRARGSLGEAYALGDNPLVLLTALQSSWEVDPSSSRYVVRPTPRIDGEGRYVENPQGRPMRIYTQLDTRLMFEDFYAKVARFDRAAADRR